jgi:hypothetical protein
MMREIEGCPRTPRAPADPLLAALRASAARLDPDQSMTYHTADRELWERAVDAVSDLLVLCILSRRQDLDDAAFHQEVAQLVQRTDETLLIAALAWQVQAFDLLNAPSALDPAEQGGTASRADASPTGA